MPVMIPFSLNKHVGEFYTTPNYFIPIQPHAIMLSHHTMFGGHRGRDRRVVGSKATYATSVYQNGSCELKFRPWRDAPDTTLCMKRGRFHIKYVLTLIRIITFLP